MDTDCLRPLISHSDQEAPVEDARFDTLAKVLGSETTRRLTLGALIGGAFSRLALTDVAAKRSSGKCKPSCSECQTCDKGKCHKKHGKKHCNKGKCKPKANGTLCSTGACVNGTCTNLQTDEANCGTIGNACGTTQVCQEGTCFSTSICPATTTASCPGGTPTICGAVAPGCLCSRSAEGNVVCAGVPPTFACGTALPCTNSAACGAGSACIEIGTCCPGLARTCFPNCPAPIA